MNLPQESPPNSLLVLPIDPLSPPPTPSRKRARRAASSMPVPMFFPVSGSLLLPDDMISPITERKYSKRSSLSSDASLPTFSLKARPIFGTRIQASAERVSPDQMPPLPFMFPESLDEDQNQQVALSSRRKGYSPLPEKLEEYHRGRQEIVDQLPTPPIWSECTKPVAFQPKEGKVSASPKEDTSKLPSFHRNGILHRANQKRNSVGARCA